jgi:hypothetical protein
MYVESTSYTVHLEHAAWSQNCCITTKLNEQTEQLSKFNTKITVLFDVCSLLSPKYVWILIPTSLVLQL